MTKSITNDLVRSSRAGDEFHYVWAARQCLRLLDFNTTLSELSIEGASKNADDTSIQAGEYVIDVGEYHNNNETDELDHIIYHQLKHSTTRLDQHFVPSELGTTLVGFSNRFKEFIKIHGEDFAKNKLKFSFISNRLVDTKVKDSFRALRHGTAKETGSIEQKLLRYTEFTFDELQSFAKCVTFNDNEGDYLAQRGQLKLELSPLFAGGISREKLESLVAMIKNKALPHSSHRPTITREDVLKRFEVSSMDELFPAQPKFDRLTNRIPRQQETTFLKSILESQLPIVIHASGGVGKSVLAQSLCESLPENSIGIVFDCFAAGTYRNPSSPRHEHRQALVQIVNEIAVKGLCDPLLPSVSSTRDQYIHLFRERIKQAVLKLRDVDPTACVVIFIDAADNAEIAAEEMGEHCFAHQLMNEAPPQGARIVSLCRTERMWRLKLRNNEYLDLALEAFSEAETQQVLVSKYAGTLDETEIREFQRLSGGNPRVQANALDQAETLKQALEYLGPHKTTIDEQIGFQLKSAINKIKKNHPDVNVELLCSGLAALPPFIPIEILSIVAGIQPETIESFATDMGRPLWLIEDSLQFRDEPTETWFKKTFETSQEQLDTFIRNIKPLTHRHAYAAESLPPLLLKSQHYDELIELALSEDFLPDDSPIDRRNIQVKRLQFSLKAALKKNDLLSVGKLALRAGEETAGNQRQLDLFAKNIDLLPKLQTPKKVQEIAFQRQISSSWDGSENTYSASLLSHIKAFRGEAKGYLRSANNWLRIFFEERDKKKQKDRNYKDKLTDEDIVEHATAYMNIHGEISLIEFFSRWQPSELAFRIGSPIIRRLLDQAQFETVNELAITGKNNPYFILAVANELAKLCKFIPKESVESALIILTHKRTRIPKPVNRLGREESYLSAYVAVAEAALFYNIDSSQTKRLLRLYTPERASQSFTSNHGLEDRTSFLKAHTIINYLSQQTPHIESLLPKEWVSKDDSYERESDKEEFKQIIDAVSPWLSLRLNIILDNIQITEFHFCVDEAHKQSSKATSSRYKQYDPLPHEIRIIRFEMIALSEGTLTTEIEKFSSLLKPNDNTIRFFDRMRFCRIAFRDNNLETLRHPLEQSCYQLVQSINDEPPDSIANYYVDLARAVLPQQKDDAKAYFDIAIEVVSKFGDEGMDRWQAVNALGLQASRNDELSPTLAYRFARCCEVISEHTDRGLNWNEVTKTLSQISAAGSFTVLSRLRDRNAIYFDDNVAVLAESLVSRRILSPEASWALTSFFATSESTKLVTSCLEQSTNKDVIFNRFIQKARLETKDLLTWENIKAIAQKHHLLMKEIDEVINFTEKQGLSKESHHIHSSYQSDKQKYNYDELVADIDCSRAEAVDIAYKRFDEINSARSPEVFWKTIISKVPVGSELLFVNAVTNSQKVSLYILESIFEQIPESWWQKISFKRNKKKIFTDICHQHGTSLLSNTYSYKHHLENFFEKYDISEQLIATAIIQGLVGGQDILYPGLLFALVKLLARMLSKDDAEQAFEYSLERLELFIDETHAGGEWEDNLAPPTDLTEAYTGMVWATLASPHAKARWQATHCVRQLGELGCENEISALIAWMNRGKPNAFIDIGLPFYELHAQQYLLIALTRIAVDNPNILLPHAEFLKHLALTGTPHVLIRHFAAKTALLIEDRLPSTYDTQTKKKLQTVNASPFPKLKLERNTNNSQKTPWDIEGDEGTHERIHFGWDFERYWYEPLGDAFNVSSKQVQDIADKLIRKEWKQNVTGYIDDPRAAQWRNRQHDYSISHSHGSYPKSDNLRFYYFYHAMFCVAGKLLEAMPIVRYGNDWQENNKWKYWFNRHTLTLNDDRWLADTLDPEPLQYRHWFDELEKNKDWRWQVMPNDFLDVLIYQDRLNKGLNIGGRWSYAKGHNKESISIASAFVSPKTSMSLLRALQSCSDLYDYKIPDADDEMEINNNNFVMQGWLSYFDADKNLDEYDPYAESVPYPALSPATFIQKQFSLCIEKTRRQWLNTSNEVCMISEIWSNGEETDHGECKARGRRIKAPLSFLTKVLTKLNKDLIIEVQIEREYCDNYRYRNETDEIRYAKPYCQLFLLDQSGTLRNLHTYHELGEIDC